MSIGVIAQLLYSAVVFTIVAFVFLTWLFEGRLPLMPTRNKCRSCGNVDVGGWGRCPKCGSIDTREYEGIINELRRESDRND